MLTELTLQGQTCTFDFENEFEEPACTDLGTAEVLVDVMWDGVGGLSKEHFKTKTTFDGTRFMSRGKFSFRDADVVGGLSGELVVDFGDGFGSLTHQSTGDFALLRPTAIP